MFLFCRICIFLHIRILKKNTFIIAKGTRITGKDRIRILKHWQLEALRQNCFVSVEIDNKTKCTTMYVKEKKDEQRTKGKDKEISKL